MGWSGIEIGNLALTCLVLVIGTLPLQLFMWWERRSLTKALHEATDHVENLRPRQEFKIQPDQGVPPGRAFTLGTTDIWGGPTGTYTATAACPLCKLIDSPLVPLSGDFLCKSCYFKQTGKLWGVDDRRKPKVITEEREALIEQRLAKEAQARDPIFP